MMIIDHHTGRYAPINTGNVGPNRTASNAAPQSKAQPTAGVVVHISGKSTPTSPPIYSNPSQLRQTPTTTLSDAIRELAPAGMHPKALIASNTFLDIAHFDDDLRLVDIYA